MYTFAFVGAGPAAIALFSKLLRTQITKPIKFIFVSKGEPIAYQSDQSPIVSTNNPVEACAVGIPEYDLLNQWLTHTPPSGPQLDKKSVCARKTIGQYYKYCLNSLVSQASSQGHVVEFLDKSEAIDLTNNGTDFTLAIQSPQQENTTLTVNRLALCVGNNSPQPPEFVSRIATRLPDRVIPTMWPTHHHKAASVPLSADIAIIGTSFSAMDFIMIRNSVIQNRKGPNRAGKIQLFSGTGLLHYPPIKDFSLFEHYRLQYLLPSLLPINSNCESLASLMSRELQYASTHKIPWNVVARKVNEQSNHWWDFIIKLENDAERIKFIRAHWSLISAIENSLQVPAQEALLRLKQYTDVTIAKGRIIDAHVEKNVIVLCLSDGSTHVAEYIVNTAGLSHDFESTIREHTILKNAYLKGYISPHSFTNLGVAISSNSEVCSSIGNPTPKLHALGRLIEGYAIEKQYGPSLTGNTSMRGIVASAEDLGPRISSAICEDLESC